MKLKVLIADDEAPARERLKRLLGEITNIDLVGEVENGIEVLKFVDKNRVDLVFLDIEMPLLNGLEVAMAIQSQVMVIFATAYDQYALKAFDRDAIDYLLKPFKLERLQKAIEKATKAKEQSKPTIIQNKSVVERIGKLGIKSGTKIMALDVDQISTLGVCGAYSEIVVGNERHIVDDSLTQLIQRLPPDVFLRVHRSSIINLKFVKELKRLGDRKYVAIMSDYFAQEIPISRESLAGVKMALLQ